MVAVVIWIHNCLFLRSLFTFYVLCSEKKIAGKNAKAGKLVRGVRTGKSGPLQPAQLANQIQGFTGFRTAQMHEKIIQLYVLHQLNGKFSWKKVSSLSLLKSFKYFFFWSKTQNFPRYLQQLDHNHSHNTFEETCSLALLSIAHSSFKHDFTLDTKLWIIKS